jgi:hypothetical protein
MKLSRYRVVSSLAADGTPQSALVGVAITSNLEVVFDTLRTTRKYANLMERRLFAGSVVGRGTGGAARWHRDRTLW